MNQEGINNVMATNMSLGQQPQVAQPAQTQGQPAQGQGLQSMVGMAQAQPAAQPVQQGLQAMVNAQQPAEAQPAAPQVDGPMVIQSDPAMTGGTQQETANEQAVNSNGSISPLVDQPIVFDMGSTTTEKEETTEPTQEVATTSTATPEKKTGVVVESLLGDEPKKEQPQVQPVVEQLVSTGVNNAPKQVENLVVNTPGAEGASTLEPAVVPTLNTPQTNGDIKSSVESLMGVGVTAQSSVLPRHPEYTLDPEVAKKHEPLQVETL